MRRFLIILLVLFLPWQPISWAAVAGGHSDDDSHVLAHWDGQAHHHHADGSITVDHSDDSVQHLLADSAFSAPSIMADTLVLSACIHTEMPYLSLPSGHAPPFLEGRRRPPRTASAS